MNMGHKMKALILNSTVVQVEETEFEVHSSMTWVDCSLGVDNGYIYKDGVFTPPLTDEEKVAELLLKYPAGDN